MDFQPGKLLSIFSEASYSEVQARIIPKMIDTEFCNGHTNEDSLYFSLYYLYSFRTNTGKKCFYGEL